MKIFLPLIALLGIGGHIVFADGYPFDPSTQQVTRDTLRIRLSEPQMESISASGLVNLTESQLSLVQRFYPNAGDTQSLITATFNDNNEGLSDEDVHVFWVAAREIAVTLNPKVIASEALRKAALSGRAVAQPSDIRIAPNGQIYIAGRRASMNQAIALISDRSEKADSLQMAVAVCVAPPFESSFSIHKDPHGEIQETATLDKLVLDTFHALVKHGESKNIAVNRCW